MKSARLLAMLLLLQAKGRASARQIAVALEISQRTVYRDIDALSAAGVPVHAERGAMGGIVLAEGYRKALTQLADDEIRALFISGDNPLADIGLADGRHRALEKLAGALSEPQRRAAHMVRSRILLDQRRWKQSAQPREHLAALRRAIWEDRRVVLRYRDRNRKPSERVIDPLGLVAKAGIWYLVARSRDEMRTFRAERIVGVEERQDRFERPDFDLDAFWREHTTRFEESVPAYPVTLQVPDDAMDEVTAYWETQLLDGTPAGSEQTRRVRVNFPGEEPAIHQLVAWGQKVRILDPAELLEKVIACARDVLVHYAVKA